MNVHVNMIQPIEIDGVDNVENIYNYFKDLIYYKKADNIKELEELLSKEGTKKCIYCKRNLYYYIDYNR